MTKARELSELGSYLNVSGGVASVNNITVSSNLEINVVVANGSVGTAGQMLTSNGSGVYWLSPQIGDITNVIAGTGLTGGGSSGEVTVSLATSGVVANTYGNSSSIPVITVDTYGRLTNVSTAAAAVVTNFTYTGANNTFSISTGDGSTFTANITAANATLAGVVTVLDSVTNTSVLIAASANSVKNAYDRAIDANTRAASAQTAAISAYSNATSYADSAAATAYSNAVSVASADATNKAANAYSNAVSYAATIAGTAYSNAVATAAGDATLKANNAYTTAVSTAASDATNKAANAYSNAVSYAATIAGTAYSNAVSTAAADATSKANNAYTTAVAAAASDATSKANNAYTTAVAAAASDATSKANNAYTTAVSAASTDATNKAANAYSNATTFASNASNISTGTLAEPRLPYRMNQDVRTTDSVTFANGSFTGTVSVGGDLIITGNVESTNVQSLAVSDPLIKLGVNNPADTSWGGFTFHYSGSGNTTNHAGLVRNPSTKEFLLMSTYGDEVNVANNNSINVADPSFSYANLQLNALTAQNATVSGNVGIGTTSPASKLHIQGSAPELRLYSDTTTGSTINFIDQSWQSQIVGSGGSIAFNAGGTTERMRIDSGGNVGIGTNSPTRNIHIQSGGTDPGILITTSGGANPSYIFLDSSDSNILDIENPNGIAFNGTSGVERMRITSAGDVGIGTSSPDGILHVRGNIIRLDKTGTAEPTIRFRSANDSYSSEWGVGHRSSSNDFAIRWFDGSSTWSERFSITTAGNVGIGTGSPAGKLAVASSSSNGTTISAWSSSHSIFGPNAGSTTGAALGLGYNTATDTAEIVSIAPGVAWKNLWISAVTTDINTLSGRVQTNQSFRAPIFYDSDNTGFYLNPNDLSNVYQLQATNYLSAPTYYSQGDFNLLNTAGNGYNQVISRQSGDNWIVYGGGSVRAPVFYDSADSGYFLDLKDQFNNTYAKSLGGFYVDATGHYFRSTASAQWAGIDSDFLYHYSDIRSGLFYDYDNTTYYLDPASTSVLNDVIVTGNISIGNTIGDPLNGFRIDAYNNDLAIVGGSSTGAAVGTSISFRTAPAGGGELNRMAIDADGNVVMYGGSLFAGSGAVLSTGGFGAYDTTNDPYAKVSVTRSTDANYAYYGLVRYGQMVYQMGIDTSNRFWIGGGTGGYNGVRNDTYLSFSSAGDVTAKGDFRAPLFYDSNNTAYFLDAASGSTSLFTAGLIRTYGWVQTGYLSGGVAMTTNDGYGNANITWNHIGGTPEQNGNSGRIVVNTDATSGVYMDFQVKSNVTSGVAVGLTSALTAYETYTEIKNSTRSPIYYDSNNTAYFIDPTGNSVLTSFNLGGGETYVYSGSTNALNIRTGAGGSYKYFGFESGGRFVVSNGGIFVGGYLDIQYNSGTEFAGMAIRNNYGSASLQASNFIDFNNENGIPKASLFGIMATNGAGYLQFFSTAPGVSRSTDSRTTTGFAYYNQWQFITSAGITTNILYDSDNTGYYLDPNSTTNLQNLSIQGSVFSTIDSPWYYDAAVEIRERNLGGSQADSFNNAPRLGFHWGGRVAMQLALDSSTVLNAMNGDCSGYTAMRMSDLYANVLYDRNNTAYYADPASTSVFNALTVGGSPVMRGVGQAGATGVNWNTLGNNQNTIYEITQETFNIGSGSGNSNFPTTASYAYGTLINFGAWGNARAQMYISHAGNDLIFRGGWTDSSWQTWNKVLTDQNYNSYAPTLTGTGASGTWGISISGTAATATALASTTNFFVNRGDFGAAAVDTVTGLGVWNQNNVGDSHTLLVFGAGGSTSTVQQRFHYTGSMEFRNRTDSANWTAWKTVLTSANYNSYSPTLTGTGASGTWGINVTGAAGSAANITGGNQTGSYEVTSGQSTRWGHANQTDSNDGKIGAGLFGSGLNIIGTQTVAAQGRRVRIWGTVVDNNDVEYIRNTGTWGISITGNAATASNLTSTRTNWGSTSVLSAVVGQLAWRHYGSNHTIFDASTSLSPDGTSVNNTNPDIGWAGTYPTLMGWNGVNTYGVRVDSARLADGPSGSTFTASGDFRAPIFYDSNDTNYFLDPANNVDAAGKFAGGIHVSIGNTSGRGIILADDGDIVDMNDGYCSMRFSLGVRVRTGNRTGDPMYELNSVYGSSNLENQRGLVINGNYTNGQYSHRLRKWDDGGGVPLYIQQTTGTAGSWSTLASFGASNNRWHFHVDGIAYSSSDFRAPIFYDANDTNFYLNPNGFSRVQTFGVVGQREYPGSINSDWEGGYYHFGPDNNTPTGGYGHAHIIRLSADWNVQMFFPTSNTNEPFWLRRKQNGTYSAWRRMIQEDEWISNKYFGSDGAIYGVIFYDTNNSAYYVDPTGTSVLNGLTVGNGQTSSTITMTDTDEGSRSIHCNSNRIGFLTQAGGWGSYCHDDGYWVSDASVRAPIFYDSENTNYYMNLNGYSQHNGNGNTGTASGVGFNIWSTDGNGAIMAFHRGGAYAVNMGLDSDNVFRIGGWSASANRLQMDMSGNLTMAGNVTAYSDARKKKDVRTIDNALDLVSRMRGVRFTRIDTEAKGVGVIAQEMLEVLPEVVQQGIGDDDTLSVAYGNIVGVLIEAIKELKAEIEELKANK